MSVPARVLASEWVSLRRFGFVCVVSLVALVVDLTLFEIFPIGTPREAVEQFLIMVAGSYLGLTLADGV
ncbi:hypothetical protein ACFQH3_09625 [Haladaptatus sp. GCM10025707]|uniref:hypothetical protein n=1 Tax=unclassified Haladaptatus TaxID=2622732 RepID=UPI0023E7C7AB|nr:MULTISPECIES: hypothetical protein [unclassified Haladaptatus]